MHKKPLLFTTLFLLSPLLAACSGTSTCDQQVTADRLTFCLPVGWEQVSEETLRQEGVPEETVAAFEKVEANSTERQNVVLTRERIASSVTSMKYANASIAIVGKTPEYKELEKREVKAAGQDTLLHIFTARPVAEFPVRRFYQITLVFGTTGYVVTGTLPFAVGETAEEELIGLLLSVAEMEEE